MLSMDMDMDMNEVVTERMVMTIQDSHEFVLFFDE
jgi:hypothetical protein